jgi:hypothetical protein
MSCTLGLLFAMYPGEQVIKEKGSGIEDKYKAE